MMAKLSGKMKDPDNITGKYILNDFGENVPCPDLHKWAKWMETGNRESCHLVDHVGPLIISTVFLGLDHSFGNGPPILWELMVFSEDSREWEEHHTQRFTHMKDAHEFHRGYVEGLREKFKNTSVTLRETDNTSTET